MNGPGVWTAVIAVVGTLAGVAITAWSQTRSARAHRKAARQDTRRDEAVAAVTELVVALSEHRRATWVERHSHLAGADPQVVADATTAAHETWARTSAALVTMKLLVPQLTSAAEAVTEAIWEMSVASSSQALETRRAEAADALARLQQLAHKTFGDIDTAP